MKKHFKFYISVFVIVVALVGLLVSQTPEPTARTNWYETMMWIKTGAFTFTNKTLTSPTITSPDFSTGSLTLANDETISNATDGDLAFMFNDDAVTLGEFFVGSTVDTPSVADNDHIDLIVQFNDDASNYTNYGKFIVTATDVSNTTEDSKIGFEVITAGAASVPLELTGDTMTLDRGATIANTGTDSLVITEAGSRFAGSLRVSGAAYAQSAEVNGRIVLANDEAIYNSPDGDVYLAYDDDAATLGEFFMFSSNDNNNIADNDLFNFHFQSWDEDSTAINNWVTFESKILDATANSKDSHFAVKTYAGNSQITGLTVAGGSLTLNNGGIISNPHADTLKITETVTKVNRLALSADPTLGISDFRVIASASGAERLGITIGGVEYILVATADSADYAD